MKYLYLLSFFLLLESQVYCQGWQASNSISGNQVEPRYSCIDNQNNNFILSTFLDTVYNPTAFVSYGRRDILINKIDANGIILWGQRIGSDSAEVCGGIAANASGDIFITGSFSKSCRFSATNTLISSGDLDVFLANYSTNGNLNWAKKIARGSNLQVTTDIFSDESSIIITGYFAGTMIIGDPLTNADTIVGDANYTSFISKFDLNGELIWSNSFKSTSNNTSFRRVSKSENGYYFGGSYQGTLYLDITNLVSLSNSLDMFLYKTDFDGNGQWARSFKGISTESFRSLENDEYDNVYVLGSYSSTILIVDSTETNQKTYNGNLGGYATFIAKYNRSGILQWLVKNRSTVSDYYYDIAIRNNIIYSSGYFANQIIFNQDTLRTSDISNKDAFLGVFNEIGNPITGESIPGIGNYDDAAISVSIDNASKAYIVGSFKSPTITIGDSIYHNSHYKPNPPKSDLYFAIYQHELKPVITSQENVSCNGLSDGLLQVTSYFGKPPYSYTWSHDANLHSNTAENLPAGDYTVTVKDANNMEASFTVPLTQPLPLAANALINPVTCHNFNTGAIDLTVTGGTPGYEYSWNTVDGSGITPKTQDQTGLTSGTYSLTVEDGNSCTLSANYTVTQPLPVSFGGSVATSLTFPPGNNGAVDLHITGGNSPFATQWTGPSGYTSALEDLSGLTEGGLYSVALTDSKNCLADTSLVVNDGTTLIAQVTAKTPVLCFGDNNGSAEITVINGITPYSYQWSDGLTTPLNTRTNMAPGTYQVLVSDAALPVAHTTQVEVVIDGPSSALALLLTPKNLTCYQDTSGVIDLTVSGGTLPYRYAWNTGYKGENLVNILSGSYSVTVTDTNNCSAQSSIVITEPAGMQVDITLDTRILCHGDNTASATATVTGGSGSYSYLWTDPGTQVTKTAVQLLARNYEVTVTDQNGCSISEEILITQPDSLSVSTLITPPSCPGDQDASLVPTVSGGTALYDFVWSNNVFQRVNSNVPAGTYSLIVTDINNCSISDTFVVNDPPPVVISQVDSVNASCFGVADGSIHIDASGGTGSLNYSADNGLSFKTTPDIGSLPAGIYTVMVKDSNDCASPTQSITVDQPSEITLDTILVTDASCYGYADGSISITALGGTGIFEYSADNGNTFVPSPTIVSLETGDHQVVVKDDANCLSAANLVNIGPNEEFTVDTIEVVRGNINDPLGSISVQNTGGNSPVSFVIVPDSSSNTTGVFEDLVAQNYRLFAIDATQCKSNELLVSLPEPQTELVVYDAFSPNEDGMNDVWNIPGIANYPNCSVKIFNTWGVAVFTSKGYGTPWDGKYKGNDLPSGTYYYVIDPGDGSGELTGPVSLVK